MVRIVFIVIILTILYLLIRNRLNIKLQTYLVFAVLASFIVYVTSVLVVELIH